jgi:hypothetical protein
MFAICEKPVRPIGQCLIRWSGRWSESEERTLAKGKNVTCEACFFRRNLLCALRLDEPCATYRPDSPEGLRPPKQLRFEFREQRTKSVYAFPSAEEQAARHDFAAA